MHPASLRLSRHLPYRLQQPSVPLVLHAQRCHACCQVCRCQAFWLSGFLAFWLSGWKHARRQRLLGLQPPAPPSAPAVGLSTLLRVRASPSSMSSVAPRRGPSVIVHVRRGFTPGTRAGRIQTTRTQLAGEPEFGCSTCACDRRVRMRAEACHTAHACRMPSAGVASAELDARRPGAGCRRCWVGDGAGLSTRWHITISLM